MYRSALPQKYALAFISLRWHLSIGSEQEAGRREHSGQKELLSFGICFVCERGLGPYSLLWVFYHQQEPILKKPLFFTLVNFGRKFSVSLISMLRNNKALLEPNT